MSEKLRYEIDLSNTVPIPALDVGLQIRTVSPTDLAGLARLMLDAYVATIDYEDENLDDAVDEVRSFLDNPDSLLDRSYILEDDGEIVSAVLVSMSHGRPFIGYVMTLPSRKKHGLARHLIIHALNHLAEDGHERVVLYITEGNTPSENLFRLAGACPILITARYQQVWANSTHFTRCPISAPLARVGVDTHDSPPPGHKLRGAKKTQERSLGQ